MSFEDRLERGNQLGSPILRGWSPSIESHRLERFVDLEFSNLGRTSSFLPGWWILPGAILGTLALGWLVG
jgi:hypothetical protein